MLALTEARVDLEPSSLSPVSRSSGGSEDRSPRMMTSVTRHRRPTGKFRINGMRKSPWSRSEAVTRTATKPVESWAAVKTKKQSALRLLSVSCP